MLLAFWFQKVIKYSSFFFRKKRSISTLLKKTLRERSSIIVSWTSVISVCPARKQKALWIHFSCFGVSHSDNRFTGEATTRRPPQKSSLLIPPNPLVCLFTRVLITAASVRSYLEPVQVAQVVQLLQDGRSIHGSSVLRRMYLSCTVPGSALKHIGPSWSLFLTVWWETCTSRSAGGHFAILEELDWRN